MKIYPQTAPEIPTGESSIGWEAGRAGWATVPPHHPPRGSGTVNANSPGSPGLRKQGLGPRQEGGCQRGAGGQDASTGLGLGQPHSAGSQLWWRWAQGQIHTCAPGSTCLALVPSFNHRFRPRLTRGGGQGQGRKSPWRGGLLLQIPPGPASLLPDGDHYCFRGTGKGKRAAQGRNPGREGLPLFTLQELWLGPGPQKAAQEVSLLSPHAGVLGGEALPAPPLVLGPHLRQPGGPRVGWEAVSAPFASQLGSKPSPKIKKYFGELKSAQGGDGLEGAGSRRSSKGALIFDEGGPLAPALVLF